MKLILETDRLLLRELNAGDAESFYLLNLSENVMRYTGDRSFASIEDAKTYLNNYNDYRSNGYGRWAVIEKSTKEFLGWCGLKYNSKIKETDIGFRFFEKHWNKGFATESAKGCLHYGFKDLQLKSIIGRAMAQHIASIKVLEKIGLKYEKEFDFDNNRGLIYRIENKQV